MGKNLVLLSGGIGSALAAWLTPKQGRLLYFNDTLIEDSDLYRFLAETINFLEGCDIPVPLIPPVWVDGRKELILEWGFKAAKTCPNFVYDPDGRDVWQVFKDKGYVANTRVDVCSQVLKRKRAQDYLKANPDITQATLGIDWSEIDRWERAKAYWPIPLRAPLCEGEWVDRVTLAEKFYTESGIKKPRLYDYGFPHNNCGGFCVKAGLDQFYLLFRKSPEVYLYHEDKQEALMKDMPKVRPFLRKTINKQIHYLTLKQFREEWIETGRHKVLNDFGGCACAIE